MVWFTCTSAILLITLTIMLLVLPVALPPLPPPPPVLMFIPVVILVLLLVLAVLPAGFNGVVVGSDKWWDQAQNAPSIVLTSICR
ncbi:unnamed protein product [Sphagnum jensenii]|uniref:Uncharacterized protein n=1 Tax=Sphagnum jensenii TaxID=128206 RepID=A0ABP0V6C4_9BRYO